MGRACVSLAVMARALEELSQGLSTTVRGTPANVMTAPVRGVVAHQRSVKRPDVHHLRQAYVLGDLYERAGDASRAPVVSANRAWNSGTSQPSSTA